MSLLQIFSKKEKKEYFLTVGIEEHHIRAAVASISPDNIQIEGFGESDFSEGENETEATDIAISMAEKNLPQNLLIERVIFALPQVYLKGDIVKPEYLTKLKKVSRELNLKPHGFIEYPQAISFFLEKEEGMPPTVFLLAVSRKNLTATLIRVGKILQQTVIDKSGTVTADFASILPDFKSEILPSRVIIYDETENLEDLREELLRFPWHKHSAFHHTPKIEILSNEKIMTALVEAAGTSFAFEKPVAEEPEKQESQQELQTSVITTETEAKDIPHAQKAHPVNSAAGDMEEETESQTGAFGFVAQTWDRKEEIADLPEPQTPGRTPAKTVAGKKEKSFVSALSQKLPVLSLPKIPLPDLNSSSRMKPVLILGLTLGIILVSLFSFIWYYPRATVRLIVIPQTAKENIDVLITTDESKVDTDNNYILAKIITEEVEGSKSTATTGKINIGEKAHGEATIYNKTLSGKTFPQGTILQNGTLKFTLDKEVTIASASDTGEGLSFGKVTAAITAVNIGPESNLVTGSIFTFKDFPETSYTAKNSDALTGGSSREISSVSKEDRDNLEKSLLQDLTSRAKQQVYQKLASRDRILESSVDTNIVSKKFSADIDTEAQKVSLSMTLSAGFISFSQNDLEKLSQKQLTSAPAGYTLDSGRTNAGILNSKKDKNNNITATVTLTYYFLPDVNLEKLKAELRGRTFSEVESRLMSEKIIAGVKIYHDKSLPIFSKRLPFSLSNLFLEVSSY